MLFGAINSLSLVIFNLHALSQLLSATRVPVAWQVLISGDEPVASARVAPQPLLLGLCAGVLLRSLTLPARPKAPVLVLLVDDTLRPPRAHSAPLPLLGRIGSCIGSCFGWTERSPARWRAKGLRFHRVARTQLVEAERTARTLGLPVIKRRAPLWEVNPTLFVPAHVCHARVFPQHTCHAPHLRRRTCVTWHLPHASAYLSPTPIRRAGEA